EWIERFAYRKADHIVPVTRSFKQHILKRGGTAGQITIIRNGVDFSFFLHQPRDMAYAESLGIANKFVASYVGTHGLAHGLDTLLDAAELLKGREDIVLLMAGDGAERARLKQQIDARGLSNILMLGQLPKSDMPRLWSCSDASLVLLKKQDLFLTVLPSKIFESMAMKKPIILGVRGESQELIEEAGSGLCIEPENASELADAIIKLADSKALCQELGERGFKYVQTNFNRNHLADTYVQLMYELVHSR
ncbi:MAG: glycosyltransferase family 4 protein, partial [Pseudomonadales bacterium]|nr:glycosyltransferase family 4 protein [Pseudomonadales bacterium]